MDPLIKLVALAVFIGALYTGLYYRFVRPHVHYIFDGVLQGMLFFLLVLTRRWAVHAGWLPASHPGDPWLASAVELQVILITNLVTSMGVVLIGTYLGWFKESPSMARAMERARERRLAAKEAQKLRAAGSR